MKYDRVISIAVLFLLLATALPTFAQKGDEEKGGGKEQSQKSEPQHAQKAAPQHAEKAAPQHAQKAEPQRAQKAAPQHVQKAEPQRAEKATPQHAQKAEPQRAQKAAPQHTQKAEPQRAEAQQPARQRTQTVASNKGGGGHYGRISDVSYNAHFGQGHSFHMGHPEMRGGYNRFQYGGYSWGYNQGWPVGWGYNDDFFVEYIDGTYFLCDLRFPGIQITLNMF